MLTDETIWNVIKASPALISDFVEAVTNRILKSMVWNVSIYTKKGFPLPYDDCESKGIEKCEMWSRVASKALERQTY